MKVLGAVSVKIQTIEVIAELIKKNKQNELESRCCDKVIEYTDHIVQLSSEVSELIDSYVEENLKQQAYREFISHYGDD